MSSTTDPAAGRAEIAARTLRTDRWWLPPLITAVGLIAWVAYATVRAFMQMWYFVPQYNYLTPFYSPCVSTGCVEEAAHFGRFLPDWPILPFAALTLPFLLLFRLTCYYYRKAYYRSFWFSPPACAVAEPHRRYHGESRGLGLGQNLHRYFFYLALPFPLILAWDALRAFHFPDGWGVGLGTVILLVNAVFLALYTLSCHSCRHLCGGRLNNFSKAPVRYWMWRKVSALNARHMLLAWVSLVFVALADLYVRLVAAGVISDPRLVF